MNLHPPEADSHRGKTGPAPGRRGALLLFTGLPKSGKTSLANGVKARLTEMGIPCYVLDGDVMRCGLNQDLGYSPEDRRENLRRIAEVARLLADAGVLVLAAFIAPYRESRQFIRRLLQDWGYYQCYVKCPLEICETRDTRGLYRKARLGLIDNMTGISAPYEEPPTCELVIPTNELTLDEGVDRVIDFLFQKGVVKAHCATQGDTSVG